MPIIERFYAAELACGRRYAAKQAATITECATCNDAALRRAEEGMRIVRPQSPDRARTTIATPAPARRGPAGKALRETMREMIEGTATAPRPVASPHQPLPPRGNS